MRSILGRIPSPSRNARDPQRLGYEKGFRLRDRLPQGPMRAMPLEADVRMIAHRRLRKDGN